MTWAFTGTPTGSCEGDCGACTVLTGSLNGNTVRYWSAVSCLMPLGNAHRKHIVTIERINTGDLSLVQHALVNNGATQCGFCTPGIVMSLVAESAIRRKTTGVSAIEATGGRLIVKERKVTTVDEETILKESRKQAERLWNKINHH